MPKGSNKQQETYADMTNRLPKYGKAGYYRHTHRHLLVTLLLTLLTKVAKFLSIKHKASINAISIHFESHYPSSRKKIGVDRILNLNTCAYTCVALCTQTGCKVTKKISNTQVFLHFSAIFLLFASKSSFFLPFPGIIFRHY